MDVKIDEIIPFKFSCALCGSDCSFEIPIVEQTVTLTLTLPYSPEPNSNGSIKMLIVKKTLTYPRSPQP